MPGDDSSKDQPDRKRKFHNARLSFGKHSSRGADGRKKHDMGRNELARKNKNFNRRDRNEEEANKRRKLEDEGKETVEDKPSVLPKPFTEEEIAAEEKRPKRKVAVMIGYSGTGYKGMQINTVEKTIEGDLFNAFVNAGAISKANASDPKKSSLVRCARTDKGVHAAGNVISLKLIVEDADIVQKINDNLSEQIRVWGIQRTVNSFSCYQSCDSRWYEYLIPSHAFLPPHPNSWLAKRLRELAEEADDLEGYESRQKETAGWWAEVEETTIKPILAEIDPKIRDRVIEALYDDPEDHVDFDKDEDEGAAVKQQEPAEESQPEPEGLERLRLTLPEKKALDAAVKRLRAAYVAAKRSFRIPDARLARIQPALDKYLGTRNYYNYTVQKEFKDPSAKRHIKSFKVDQDRKIVNDTEWLSIKIHGQSFMMHQIRKMIGALSLIIRCGCDLSRINDTFAKNKLAIPKVPGLGLLLERPVFETYNIGVASKYEREPIDFSKYDKEIEDFKHREIYQRVYREEEESKQFHAFYTHVDNLRDAQFLWLSSMGFAAVEKYRDVYRAPAGESGAAGEDRQAKLDLSEDEATAAADAEGREQDG